MFGCGVGPVQGRAGLTGQQGMRQLGESLQGTRAEIRLAITAVDRNAACDRPVEKFPCQAGLAYPGRADDRCDAATTGAALIENSVELRHLGLPAGERGAATAKARVEPALDRFPADQRVDRDRRCMPAWHDNAAGTGLEQESVGAQGRLADENLVGPGEVAQSGGDAGRFTQHLEPAPHQVARQHQHQT